MQTLASDLIILRKALGADVTQMVQVTKTERLSTIHFRPQSTQLPTSAVTEAGSIPGGFESHLLEVVGGRIKSSFSETEGSEEQLKEAREANNV